jgi:hypothetical protein
VEKYREMLCEEWELFKVMRETLHRLIDVKDRIFRAIADGKQVSEEDTKEYSRLIDDLYELVFTHVELLDEQAALRGKMAVEEYEGRADKDDLEEYHRVLSM